MLTGYYQKVKERKVFKKTCERCQNLSEDEKDK